MNNNLIITSSLATELIAEKPIYNYLDSFISYIDVSEKSKSTYLTALKQFFIYLQKNNVQYPVRQDILNYKQFILSTHTETTTALYIVAVRRFFEFLESENIYQNIAKGIKRPKVSTHEHKKDPLTSNQAKDLLSSIDRTTVTGKRDYAILSLMLTSGLRTIEVINANIEDLRNIADTRVLFLKGKGRDGKDEYIRVTDKVNKAISDYLITRPHFKATEPLFLSLSNHSKDNGRLTTRSVSRLVKEHLKAIDVISDRITAHSLRHTTATLSLLNGADVREVSETLRHRNINTTMVYVHSLNKLQNKTEKLVTEMIM